MTRAQLESAVFRLAADILDVPLANLGPTSSPDSIESWDSIKQLELVLAIEQAFQVELSPDDLVSMLSLDRLVDLVEHHRPSR